MSTAVTPLPAREVRNSVLEHFEILIADNERRTRGLYKLLDYIHTLPDNDSELQRLASHPDLRCDCCGELALPDPELISELAVNDGPIQFIGSLYVAAVIQTGFVCNTLDRCRDRFAWWVGFAIENREQEVSACDCQEDDEVSNV